MSEEIEQVTPGGAVANVDEAALAAQIKGNIDQSKLQLPSLKVVNGLSAEAQKGIPQGHLVNGLTGEDYGEETGIIVCGFYYGRFFSPDKDGGKVYVARGEVAPNNWPEEYRGQAFVEIDDAEEQFKEAVNNEEREWEKGPPIQTTTNFVVVRADDEQGLPMRLSMKSSDTPVANKLLQMIAFGGSPWDVVYTLKSDKRPTPNGKGAYYGFHVETGGAVTTEQRQVAVRAAVAFAQAEQSGDFEEVGTDDADVKAQEKAGRRKKAAAKAEEGLGV